MEKKNYHVLTPMANPDHEIPLLKISSSLVESSPLQGEITALNVIEVPKQAPLDVGELKHEVMEERMEIQKEMQKLALDFGQERNVIINPRVLYGRNKYNVIYNEAAKDDIDFLVLGWHGSFSVGHIYSSMVKKLVRHAPCPVGVLKNNGLEKLKNVLIPYRGSEHARFGVVLAQKMVSAHEGGKVTVLRVLGPNGNKEKEIEKAYNELEDIMLQGIELEVKVIFAKKVVEGIINCSQKNEFDLIIMGASKEWAFKNFLFGSIPDIIAERAPASVLMLRGYDQHIAEEIKEKVEKEESSTEEPPKL